MKSLFFLLLLALTALACESPSESPASPCTTVTVVDPPPEDAGASQLTVLDASSDADADAESDASVIPTVYDVVFTPTASGDVENATLRAMVLWQEATVGYVRFVAHNRTEVIRCTAATIFVEQAMGTYQLTDDEVAVHNLSTCHTISVVYPWPESESYAAVYQRLGVSPLVAVISHELGHVLGVPHSPTTSWSVMSPFINLVPTASPTCQDVNALSLTRQVIIPCVEKR